MDFLDGLQVKFLKSYRWKAGIFRFRNCILEKLDLRKRKHCFSIIEFNTDDTV